MCGKSSKADCLNWAAEYQKRVSATNFNNTVGSLKLVLDMAVEAGARYDNPAKFIKRARVIVREPAMPSQEDFQKVLPRLSIRALLIWFDFRRTQGCG